jgi:hypothetical protein
MPSIKKYSGQEKIIEQTGKKQVQNLCKQSDKSTEFTNQF